MASLTAVIPFYSLLNKEQRDKYAYIIALVVLVLNIRYGLEPPKYVYFFNTIMLTCFVKYLQSNKFGWIIAVSVCAALISFVRFPSFFVWPVVILAMVLLKKIWMHTISVVILPIVVFIGLVTLTNGGISSFVGDLGENIKESANGEHTISDLFWEDVTSTIHAIAYMLFICLPLFMYIKWKRNDSAKLKVCFIISFFIIAVIMIIHPTEHLSCALTMATVILYGNCSRWRLKGIVLGATIVITNMFCSVGSDCGFVHDYYCVSFIPFLLMTIDGGKSEDKKYIEHVRNSTFNMTQFAPLYVSLVLLLCMSTFVHRCVLLGNKYSSGIVNGGELSPNLYGLYFSKQSMRKYSDMQNEYCRLKKSYVNVIFWGTFQNHLMSFVNNQWPITDIWKIESKYNDNKPFTDLVEYVKRNKPVVIDLEKHPNTAVFMASQGYVVTNRDFGTVYSPEN